jgi:hypothetical protein
MNPKGAAMPNASQEKNRWLRWPQPFGLLVVWAVRAVSFLLRKPVPVAQLAKWQTPCAVFASFDG